MATKIVDLDDVIAEPKRVKLQGVVYELPPDLPVELYLWVQRINQGDPAALDMSEQEMVEKLYGEVLGLFRYKRPDLESIPIRMSQLIQVVARVYSDAAEEAAEKRPPQRPRSGGATKTGSRTRAKSSRR